MWISNIGIRSQRVWFESYVARTDEDSQVCIRGLAFFRCTLYVHLSDTDRKAQKHPRVLTPSQGDEVGHEHHGTIKQEEHPAVMRDNLARPMILHERRRVVWVQLFRVPVRGAAFARGAFDADELRISMSREPSIQAHRALAPLETIRR